jgi:hypothetical protein
MRLEFVLCVCATVSPLKTFRAIETKALGNNVSGRQRGCFGYL